MPAIAVSTTAARIDFKRKFDIGLNSFQWFKLRLIRAGLQTHAGRERATNSSVIDRLFAK
jgi:hypothetical protein